MASFEVTGVIHKLYDEKSGTSKGGKEWRNRVFVIDTDEEYSRKMAFTLFGDKCDYVSKCKVGESVSIKFNINCNPGTNDSWYPTLIPYAVSKHSASGSGQSTDSGLRKFSEANEPEFGNTPPEDDVPF